MPTPLLTIGMIVKNEIRCLERCLQALKPLRDAISCELIIADTGSTDGSREIAEKYADLVFDFPWIDDFSAARNAVMDRAAGQWFLTVDADEYLGDNIAPLTGFLLGEESDIYPFAFITVRNYHAPDMKGGYGNFQACRLLRMDTGLRYQGVIHERWVLPKGAPWKALPDVIFHHDGYAHSSAEEAKVKARRNLPLVEKLLEEAPKELLRWLQVVEASSALEEEGMYYARKGMEFIQTHRDLPAWSMFAPALCRTAVNTAWNTDGSEMKAWLQWGIETFPDSPYMQVDGMYYHTYQLYNQKKFSEVIPAAQGYLNALKRYRSGKYSSLHSTISVVYHISEETEQTVRLMLAESYRKMNKYQQAYQTLESISLGNQTNPKNAVFWLTTLQKVADKWDCAALVRSQLPILLDASDGTERSKARSQACLSTVVASFLPGQRHEGWRLYAGLENELGASARCMAAETAEDAELALSQVEQWAMVPVPVMARSITLGAVPPESFYERQNAETLREIASSLAQYETGWIDALLKWPERNSSFKAVQFRFEVIAAALREEAFLNAPKQTELLEVFVSTSQNYLTRLYHANLLEREADAAALPGLHRFARQLVLAHRAAEAGRQREAVQRLHAALDEAPAMKQAVEVALDMVQQSQRIMDASPELMALAEQVKALLAQYPADDPAVLTLKQSEVYQRVAFLLEEPEGVVLS